MRICRLELKAFGPFSERIIDLSPAGPGLHVIFGANEAGKSSSLRALKALLFGFPERTADNFIFPNDQLLVGGTLQNDGGESLTLFRRKKRKADLLDEQGNPLDPTTLSPFLHNMPLEVFESLHGINHDILVQGGEDILAQKGEVGQALFAAGAGISSLREILSSLETEAEAIFKPRGSKQHINRALKEYAALDREVKQLSLSGRVWQEQTKRLRQLQEKQARLDREFIEKDQLRRRLERLAEAIPLLATRDAIRSQLENLGEVVLLPDSFARQRQEVEEKLRSTTLQQKKASRRLEELTKKQRSIAVNGELLDQAESIQRLVQGLGEFKKGRIDRERLTGRRTSFRAEAAGLLKNIRPDLSLEEVESLRSVLIRKKTIQDLASRHEVRQQEAARTAKEHLQIQKELAATEEMFSALPPSQSGEDLLGACKLAQKIGDIDAMIGDKTREIATEKKQCAGELGRLRLWQGDLADLAALPLPLPESVKRFDSDFRELDEELTRLRRDLATVRRELLEAEEEINKIEYAGEVPSEKELERSRRLRDERWQLIRSLWLGEEEESRPETPATLAMDFDDRLSRADQLADRLRREADRVAAMAGLRAGREKMLKGLEELRGRERGLDEGLQELDAAWQDLWQPCAITPLTPREMLSWMQDFTTLRYRAGEIFKKENELAEKQNQRSRLRQTLLAELTKLARIKHFAGEELAPVLIFAETVFEEIAGEARKRENLSAKIRELQKRGELSEAASKEADLALERWQEEWRQAVGDLSAMPAPSPAMARDLLDNLESCFSKVKEADDCAKRIKGIDRDADRFKEEVATLVSRLAPELTSLPLEQQMTELQRLLATARENKTLQTSYGQEIGRLGEEISDQSGTLMALEKQRAALMARAGCQEAGELDEAIRRSAEAIRLREKLADNETALARIGAGIPLEELASRAAAENAEELPGRIRELGRYMEEELRPRIKETYQAIADQNAVLKSMDGRAAAAEKEEAKEEVLARISGLSERYARLKLAAKILQQEIERYRAENQDPILKIASGYFADLTIGSFTGLRTDVDDRDQPVLVGLRDKDIRVTVEGMSSGSRDQLYLALRLATLKWRLGSGEPMPFIVDDILINFDDERTRATLGLLAGLAEQTQIILFTHHRQVAEEAERLAATGRVHVHQL